MIINPKIDQVLDPSLDTAPIHSFMFNFSHTNSIANICPFKLFPSKMPLAILHQIYLCGHFIFNGAIWWVSPGFKAKKVHRLFFSPLPHPPPPKTFYCLLRPAVLAKCYPIGQSQKTSQFSTSGQRPFLKSYHSYIYPRFSLLPNFCLKALMNCEDCQRRLGPNE